MQNEDGLSDLYKFIRIGNKSLLIKGRSGTGKITLSFELASMYRDKFDTVFVSRKINEFELYKRYPWIKEFIRRDNIISVTDTETIFADSPLFAITNLLNSLTNLTTRVEDPFVALEGPTKPFVILDVWDSIAKEIDTATRIRVEKALLSLTDKHVGFIIFITEELDDTSLEHMVDGIVRLDQTFYKSYRLRDMNIEKLKGTHIIKPKVPFTLEGGRFRTFSAISHSISEKPVLFEAIGHTEQYYSTGNVELDEKLNGGFKKGSIISIEIDEEVDRFVFVPLFAPLALNFVSQGESALIISSQDQHVSAVTRYLIPYARKDDVNNFLRVVGSDTEEFAPYIASIGSRRFHEVYNSWLMLYKNLKSKSKHCIITIDYSFVELEYRDDIKQILKSIIDLCRMVRASGDLLIITSRPNYKTLEVTRSVSDMHLRIFEYAGATMLASIKPQLFLCNIQLDNSRGYPNARLLEST